MMHPITIMQLATASRVTGEVSPTGSERLATLYLAQRDYLLRCYLSSPPPRTGGDMPGLMCSSLRRMAVLSRRRGSGIPALGYLLIPAHNWMRGVDCVLVRVARGKEFVYVPIVTLETASLDLREPIYIERSTSEHD